MADPILVPMGMNAPISRRNAVPLASQYRKGFGPREENFMDGSRLGGEVGQTQLAQAETVAPGAAPGGIPWWGWALGAAGVLGLGWLIFRRK